MPTTSESTSFPTRFFSPALDLLRSCSKQRHCPELSDTDWLLLGIQRCLAPQPSGRGFLQTLASLAPALCPDNSHFFESLKSERRLALCGELNAKLCAHSLHVLPDALAAFPCLAGFDIHAGDGHYHAHATHDPADSKGKKHAEGHLYSRNLRSGSLSHLTVNDQVTRKKEHDMRGLKRQTIDTLRQGAKKGRKVLYVWDCPSLRSRPASLASLGRCAIAQAVSRNRLSSMAQVETGQRHLHALTPQDEHGAHQVWQPPF